MTGQDEGSTTRALPTTLGSSSATPPTALVKTYLHDTYELNTIDSSPRDRVSSPSISVARVRLAIDPSEERCDGGGGDDDGGCSRRRSEPGGRFGGRLGPSRRHRTSRAHRTHARDRPDDVHEGEPRRGHARGTRHETHRRAGFDEDGERGESSEPRATTLRRARDVGEVSREVGLSALGVESTDEVEKGVLEEATGDADDEVGEHLRVGVVIMRADGW